jgi:3-hydroxyisobutyrate dehydrogenase-like beta-hydroxyacid dehydrogenase
MWPVPADVPRGEQFMGMPMADLAASDQAYETIAYEAQKEHEVKMFMQAMAQKNAIQEAQQRREQISTLLRDASIEEEVLKANKMQLLYDLVGQEAPYYLQRP